MCRTQILVWRRISTRPDCPWNGHFMRRWRPDTLNSLKGKHNLGKKLVTMIHLLKAIVAVKIRQNEIFFLCSHDCWQFHLMLWGLASGLVWYGDSYNARLRTMGDLGPHCSPAGDGHFVGVLEGVFLRPTLTTFNALQESYAHMLVWNKKAQSNGHGSWESSCWNADVECAAWLSAHESPLWTSPFICPVETLQVVNSHSVQWRQKPQVQLQATHWRNQHLRLSWCLKGLAKSNVSGYLSICWYNAIHEDPLKNLSGSSSCWTLEDLTFYLFQPYSDRE